MVKKTFIIEIEIDNLEDLIKQHIKEIGGDAVSLKDGVFKWTFIYGKQDLKCKTKISKKEIEMEAKNTRDSLVGEGVVVNKFFNSLSDKIKIRKKEVSNENVKNKTSYSLSNNKSDWSLNPIEKTVLVSVVVILFLIFTFSGDKSKSVLNSNPKYITQYGKMASYSEESMKILVNCSVHKDYDCINQLMYDGDIFELPAGQEAYVVQSSLSGKVKIRLKGETQEIWTFIEAIKRE